MDILSLLLPTIEHFHSMGYWIAFLAALMETVIGIGLFIPGSTIVLLMGTLAATGYFDLGDLIWFAAIGAFIGDNINYILGRKIGSKFVKNGFWIVKAKHLKKAQGFFKKYGSKSVFWGRFIPTLKETTPFVAGAFNMNRLSFLLWNTLGAIGWSLLWILPGYFLGQSFNVAQIWLTRGGLLVLTLLFFFILIYLLELFVARRIKPIAVFIISLWRSIVEAVVVNPDVKKLKERHKSFFQFLKKRLSKKEFQGLPLTFLTFTFIYILLLFGGTVEDILNSDLIMSADIQIANVIAVFRTPEITQFFLWITTIGKFQTVAAFLITSIVFLWAWGRRQYIAPLLLTVVGSQGFTWLGKYVFHRERPDKALFLEQSFSFPSGHATFAIAFFGFLIYILLRNIKSLKQKVHVLFLGIVLIFLIGFSRLYLGVHYLSDVWGGYLVGMLWLIVGIILAEFLLIKYKKAITVQNNRAKLLSIGIFLIAIILYINTAIHYTPEMLPLIYPNNITEIINVDDIFSDETLKYTETLLGNQQEPLSFIIITESDEKLIETFNLADWELADDLTMSSIYEIAKAALLKKSYPKAPMTPDFWDTQVHNFGFEKETDLNSIRQRHHARFWRTDYVTEEGEEVYVGTASFDDGIKWAITHKISPDIDTERDFLLDELKVTGQVKNVIEESFVDPLLGENFAGDSFFTDGNIYIIRLK